MTDAERSHLEKRLIEERDRTQRALQRSDEAARIATEEDGDLTSYPQHLADEGSDTMEAEKALMLMSQEGQRLVLINAALRTLYKDPEQFGKCQNCGREIAMERLDLVPWATLCLDCQAGRENGG